MTLRGCDMNSEILVEVKAGADLNTYQKNVSILVVHPCLNSWIYFSIVSFASRLFRITNGSKSASQYKRTLS